MDIVGKKKKKKILVCYTKYKNTSNIFDNIAIVFSPVKKRMIHRFKITSCMEVV